MTRIYRKWRCSSGELLKYNEFYVFFGAGDSRVFRIDYSCHQWRVLSTEYGGNLAGTSLSLDMKRPSLETL